MKRTSTRVALYLRVSKDDDSQTVENQRRELTAFCERAGYVIVGEYVDRESGRRGKAERHAFARMFDDASRRRFDLVLFWALDRLSREGIRKTIHYLQQLDGWGVRFKSYTETYLDTENELVSHILLGVLSYFAELEAKKISERTKAGLARARAEGQQLGRPTKFGEFRDVLVQMKADGRSQAEMARETGLAYNTVKAFLRQLDEPGALTC